MADPFFFQAGTRASDFLIWAAVNLAIVKQLTQVWRMSRGNWNPSRGWQQLPRRPRRGRFLGFRLAQQADAGHQRPEPGGAKNSYARNAQPSERPVRRGLPDLFQSDPIKISDHPRDDQRKSSQRQGELS